MPNAEEEALEDRAQELSDGTFLTERRAEVHALREAGYRRAQIAEKLDLAPSTVSEHFREIDRVIERARQTVAVVDSNE